MKDFTFLESERFTLLRESLTPIRIDRCDSYLIVSARGKYMFENSMFLVPLNGEISQFFKFAYIFAIKCIAKAWAWDSQCW